MPKPGLWAQWDFTVTLRDLGLCLVGTDSLVVIGACALWALPVLTLLPMPAHLGPSTITTTPPPCLSMRPAPQDWSVLRVSEEAERQPPCMPDPTPG